MILGEKKKGPKKGPSKKMFQGEKCSVCEDPGQFQNDLFFILDLFFIDYFVFKVASDQLWGPFNALRRVS